jgi:hypothetical protein
MNRHNNVRTTIFMLIIARENETGLWSRLENEGVQNLI